MADAQYKKGVIVLTDIVNYTGQANKLGTDKTAKFNKHFEQKIRDLTETYKGEFIKTIGDATLIFFGEEENFLDFVIQLRELSRTRQFDLEDFFGDLRVVAHCGRFSFEFFNNKMSDLIGPEGIKVFRIEKYAQEYDVVVTDTLMPFLRDILVEKHINTTGLGRETLKGFDIETGLYKLIFPEKGVLVASDLLKLKMAQLEEETKTIPVFGDLYPAMSMADNFIDLDIKTGVVEDEDNEVESELDVDGMVGLDLKRERERDLHKGKGGRLPFISVKELYDTQKKGIILGLPGSGKTTILKYFAYREFKKNREDQGGKGKRMVLFIECRNIIGYDEWYRGRFPKSESCISFDIGSFLNYLAYCFLFRKESVETILKVNKEEMEKAEKLVIQAFYNSRLTVLIDALDEAPSKVMKDKITGLVKALFLELKKKKNDNNRVYLTSRYSEKEKYFWEIKAKNMDVLQPLFDVRPLHMEQLREMARYFYGESTTLYKAFDQMVWQEEIAAKVGGTPLTALLVIAYFEIFREFDTRFYMYNIIVIFILIRVWKQIKEKNFNMDMRTFFKGARSKIVLKEEPKAKEIYDALTLLSYEHMDKGRIMKEADIMGVFEKFAAMVEGNCSREQEAELWLERMKEDHLLVSAGPGEYVFIHSTVMEYLAARYIVEKWNDPLFLENVFKNKAYINHLAQKDTAFFNTEILPIAVGSGIKNGARILQFIKNRIHQTANKETRNRFYLLALKSLVEFESYIDRQYREKRLSFLHSEMEAEIESHWSAVDWVYTYLQGILLGKDKENLKTLMESFKTISRLSRPYFLERYVNVDLFLDGDSEMISIREDLLLKLINKEIIDQWILTWGKTHEEGINYLAMDSLQYNPDDRNFNYYRGLIGKELTGFFGSPNFKHSGPVTACAFSPDGKTILSASRDNTLKLWNARNGKEIRSFSGHMDPIFGCAFSPDGKIVISASADTTLKLWDAGDGKEIRSFSGHTSVVYGCAISPDGKTILSASRDNTLKLWDAGSGMEIRSFNGHTNSVTGCAFSPNGKAIVSASHDNTLKLWDAGSGKEIRCFSGHMDSVTGCVFSPDGKTILSASWDNTLKLWDAGNGKEIWSFKGHESYVHGCTFSPDAKTIISASFDKTTKLWDALSGKEIRSFKGHKDSVRSCAFSPDGKTFISASNDNTLKLWDVWSGKEIRAFNGHTSYIHSCAFSPDAKTIISASFDKTIKLWNAERGKVIRSYTGHMSSAYGCAFSPDAKTILSASNDGALKLWDVGSGKEIRAFTGHMSYVNDCAFSPDGKTIISASNDNTLKLWDVGSGKEIRSFNGHTSSVNGCAFSPDGKTILSASSDYTLKLWNAGNGKVIQSFTGHRNSIYGCAFSSDAKAILSASADKTLKLWDARSGKEIHSYLGHKSSVYGCAFSPDGKTIISASEDMTLKLWEVRNRNQLKSIKLPWIPKYIAVSPSHYRFIVITANLNGTVTMFDFSDWLGKK